MTSFKKLWNCPQNMEVDQETVFPPYRHDHSEHISYTQVMWRQNDTQKFPGKSRSQIDYPFARRKCDSQWPFMGQTKSSCIPAQSTRSQTFGAQAFESKKTTLVSSVFAAETKTTYFCRKCDVGLCIVKCFEKWHTSVNLCR